MRRPIVMYGVRVLLILLVSSLSTGCFVLDELDKGAEIQGRTTAKKPKQDDKGEGRSFAQMLESGSEALGEVKGKVQEAMKPGLDPDNTIIRCRVDGRAQFMRKHDCLVLGGTVIR